MHDYCFDIFFLRFLNESAKVNEKNNMQQLIGQIRLVSSFTLKNQHFTYNMHAL